MEIIVTLRQFKIGPFAIFDLVISYVAIYLLAPLLSKIFSKLFVISRTGWLWLTLPLSILIHLLFQQNTPLTQMILNPSGNFILKAMMIFMVYKGFANISSVKKKYDDKSL